MTPSTVRDNLKALSAYLYESSGPDFMFESVEQAITLLGERGWQPIETAPKMKNILLWAATHIEDGVIKNWKMATGFYHTGYENHDDRTPWSWDGAQLMKYDLQPTHWMPLPEPPK